MSEQQNSAPQDIMINDFYSPEVTNAELVIDHEIVERQELSTFSDVFSKYEIGKDMELVQYMKRKFQYKYDTQTESVKEKMFAGKKRSESLEVIIGNQIELNNWFGPDALFNRTTEYDDFFNGVDAVAEFKNKEKPQRLALAIDATMKADLTGVKKKIDRNISKLLNNNLEVKYFESKIDNYKGKLKNVIPVVLGVEGEDADELVHKFAELIHLKKKLYKSDSDEKLISEKQDQLAKHPVQIIFLKEIKLQLDMYRHILKKENNDNIFVNTQQIDDMNSLIDGILKDKQDIEDQPEMKLLEHDAMYNLIQYISKSETKRKD